MTGGGLLDGDGDVTRYVICDWKSCCGVTGLLTKGGCGCCEDAARWLLRCPVCGVALVALDGCLSAG